MATLVLSTVGTALGGPVGGAIGSLIGQSIDQQIFASPTKGPRLGDLAVQTSSYGTQVPRLYGTMRVAGSVIWATDPVESSVTTGAKGQPDTTYSYAVSFAVALSSRPLREIRRIWADGKLLRGEAGDFKVSTDFRFYEGSEDQVVDPLIGSIEGTASSPAYRGLAMAVFENLELAEYGNRIPFLTFEVVADAQGTTLAGLLADASDNCIDVADERTIVGYAASGKTVRAAVEPLVNAFDVELVDAGGRLSSAAAGTATIGEDELGSTGDESPVPRIQRDQDAARSLPSAVLLTYYDPDRDYQSGLARADGGARDGDEKQIELPAVLAAWSARSLAEEVMARSWARRDRVRVRLPTARLELLPGSRVQLAGFPGTWRVERSTIDGLAVSAELRRNWRTLPSIVADPGRSNAAQDRIHGPLSLALVELPSIDGSVATSPCAYLAASSADVNWRTTAVEVSGPNWTAVSSSATRRSVLGEATTVLGDGASELVDDDAVVDVQLIDANQWLTSYDDDALIGGANLALVGSEILQFGMVEPLGGGTFRLSRLLRGCGGTEWATGSHSAGETFLLIDAMSLRQVALPEWASGSGFTARPLRDGASVSLQMTGESLRPWSPVALRASRNTNGDLLVDWIRRSRVRSGWLDDVDMPLGERIEQYRVTVTLGGNALEYDCGAPTLTVANGDLSPLGPGTATVAVRQIGDWGASRPAETQINL